MPAATLSDASAAKPSIWALCAGLTTPRDRANLRRVNLALAIWAVVFLGSTALLRFGAVEGAAAWLVALAPATMAVVSIRHYVRFLRAADELLQRVQLEGLAIGFGAGFVFMTSWRLLERAGAPSLDVSDGLLVMVVFWALGQWFAARRYS
jgi:hypothetical protein